MTAFAEQLDKVRKETGFIAALDQSGGSTPKALGLYDEMRSRIVTSDAFNGKRVIGAILFEGTMDREINGKGSANFLWSEKNVVPFLKVDKGLEDEVDGVQLMKSMPELDTLLDRACSKGVFGTKMRSVVKQANEAGIRKIVDQQIAVGQQILAKGLVPILEPEIDIHCPDKAKAEELLRTQMMAGLDGCDVEVDAAGRG